MLFMTKKRTIETLLLDGGCACFDFINTVHSRVEEERHEYLESYKDLITWCRHVELLSESRLAGLEEMVNQNPGRARKAFSEVIETREMLYRFFSSVAAGQPVAERDMKAFNRQLSKTLVNLEFREVDGKLKPGWKTGESDFSEPLWRIMKSAYELLTEEETERIKECEACGWIFLDQSKNKSRRWCNMQTCGSIHKAKKYYHRQKKE